MPQYSDLDTMLRDITGFIRSTGREVLLMDDPKQGLLGFVTGDEPEVRWQISLVSVFQSELDPLIEPYLRGNGAQRALVVNLLKERAKEDLVSDEEAQKVAAQYGEMLDRGWKKHGRLCAEIPRPQTPKPDPDPDETPWIM